MAIADGAQHHMAAQGSPLLTRGSNRVHRSLCWPNLLPREFCHLLGAWIWDTGDGAKAYLVIEPQAPLLFYMVTYCTARGSLDHVKGDYVALG